LSSSLEGRIDIRLTRHGDAVTDVEIRSSRPQLAQKLMAGRTPEEAADLAGLIFSLCGKAQKVAAQAACEAARGLIPQPAMPPSGANAACWWNWPRNTPGACC
jgi:Ni,Fe-hydrogenase III large subunit